MSENALQKIEPLPAPATSVEGMITLAIERGATVETLERLMAIRREVRAEQGKEAFDRALAAFQAECPTIRKNAKVMNKDGRSVRYQYAPLDAIIAQVKELLQRHGFSYTVNAAALAGSVKATCKLTHAYGHSESSEFEVPIDKDAYMNPAQQVASALTFAKRYAFCNAAGIMTGDADDDSQGAFNAKDKERGVKENLLQSTKRVERVEQSKPSPATQAPAAGASPSTPAQVATEEQRQRWIRELKRRGEYAVGYCRDKEWLLPPAGPPGDQTPGEPIELLEARHVPTTKREAVAILAELDSLLPEDFVITNAPPATVPQPAQSEPDHHDTDWYQFPVPFGKDAGKMLGELEKNTLFGWWANFTVEREYKGKPRPKDKIETDRTLRVMLDKAGVFYKFEEPDKRD